MFFRARRAVFRSENSLHSDSSPHKTARRALLSYVALAVWFLPITVGAQTLPDAPSGYVTDAANVLSAETKAALEARLTALDASTTEQIAVVTVPSLEGDYIEHYAAQLFEKWGIGEAKKDTGVLLLLALEERELRIEVGYGLEGALPDSVADRIIRETLVPRLREGDYDGAISAGVESVIAAIQGEYVAAPGNGAEFSFDPEALIFFLIFGLQWFAAMLGRTKSWWLGGIIGAAIGAGASTFLGWWLAGGAILTLILFVFGLAFDYIVSSTYKESLSHGDTPPWWTGGGGFGGSSRGGGFGGFGGGMSGGGGASGRW